MGEINISPLGNPADRQPLGPQQLEVAMLEAERAINEVAPHVGRLFGLPVGVRLARLGEGAGMATDPENGDVLVDPRFFVEAGYESDDATVYGMAHETVAHVRRIMTEPEATVRINRFTQRGKAQAIFFNVFEDIAGNNLIHAVLPKMKDVADQLYTNRLFPEDDLTGIPRHLQFLYKILREEMSPESQTAVLPEVDEAIGLLRNFEGKGDLIKYTTAASKSARRTWSSNERFDLWTRVIYPIYEGLIKQDRQDPERQDQQQQQGQSGQGQGQAQNQPGQPQQNEGQPEDQSGQGQQTGDQQQSPEAESESGNEGQGEGDQQQSEQDGSQERPGQNSSGGGQPQRPLNDNQRFGSYYDDYTQNRHPHPMNEEDTQRLQREASEKAQREARNRDPRAQRAEQERRLDEKLRATTGHTLHEKRRYDAERERWQSAIDEMREAFSQVINRRVAQKRGLSRHPYPEGAVLDSDRLVQTIIDVQNLVPEPEAYLDYVKRKGEVTAVGKTDYVFAFDMSDSMNEEDKAQNAASSSVIALEGLSGLQRDIEAMEAELNMDLELDIRTAIFGFGNASYQLKPLSTSLTDRERLDTYSAVAHPKREGTYDFLVLEEIERWPVESDRRKILVVVSDGESKTPDRARKAIERLRDKGWFVYGISIGSDAAKELYKPTAQRVDDPAKLPDTLHTFIEATIK